MIIHDFHIIKLVFICPEAYSKLVIDVDAVLTGAISLQKFKTIARRDPQIINGFCTVHHHQLLQGSLLNNLRKSL